MNYYLHLALLLTLNTIVLSKNIIHKFNVSYISGAPDGVLVNHILGVNGKFPGVEIRGKVGDILKVRVENNINSTTGETPGTAIHWHGLFLPDGLGIFDGPRGVTQCPISYKDSMEYNFPLLQSGTYWWHAHAGYQYTEGLLGPLIIEDDADPYLSEYDIDSLVFTLSDWYHTPAKTVQERYLNPRSVFPVPNSALINGRGLFTCANTSLPCTPQEHLVYEVIPGARYRIRIINVASFWRFRFSIDGHQLEVIEVDGVLTKRVPCDYIVLSPAQRYSVIVTMNAESSLNQDFLIRSTNPDESRMPSYNSSAILRYTKPYTGPVSRNSLPGLDDMLPQEFLGLEEWRLVPYDDSLKAPEGYDELIRLELGPKNANGIQYLAFNDTIHMLAEDGAPILYRMIKGATIPQEANPLPIKYGSTVQVEIYNSSPNNHPFHLHGHNFWMIANGPKQSFKEIFPYKRPILRDTFALEGNATAVFRFKADNPGAWLFHCHINWHHIAGLAAVFIEGAEETRRDVQFPEWSKEICMKSGIDLSTVRGK